MKEIADLLSKGLLAGYAGKDGGLKREVARRGGMFPLETSHLEGNGEVYHDEWIGRVSGGGQEIVQTKDGKRFTRVYAGGVAKQDILDELGITVSDVLGRHKRFLKEIGKESRFNKDIEPQRDGEWVYEYKEIESVFEDHLDLGSFGFGDFSDIHLSAGIEIINYEGQMVFAHVFILAPVTS